MFISPIFLARSCTGLFSYFVTGSWVFFVVLSFGNPLFTPNQISSTFDSDDLRDITACSAYCITLAARYPQSTFQPLHSIPGICGVPRCTLFFVFLVSVSGVSTLDVGLCML
ncbi:hypothetical protein HYPSUDRAFT_449311 [Hypholoma sublateritium FD-334 SS-4]|uniref:Uncharacterized protein n=1 Tax=Hypholoma sublateritium (strain FD-334 SS-4) TaxID=945553 RepID=A0A0D2LC65_HYPSF|nr:hypothetical protein HYPSUDRAFT_449311 [Hypholoma sublateritium FD-334 SS-4]